MQHRSGYVAVATIMAPPLRGGHRLDLVFCTTRRRASEVQNVWKNARDAGGCSFRVDILEKVIPLALVSNIGRAGREY